MRLVLGALGCLARESRPDLSGPVSILQSRFNRAQVSDKAHTDLALLVCKIPVDQIVFVSYGDASGGSTRAEQAQAGYVIMFVDMSWLAGLSAPVTLVSSRSHRVKRVVASASAAEAMILSEAIAQDDWVRAPWSEKVLGLSLRDWRERKDVPTLIPVTDSKGNYDHLHNETIGPSGGRRSAIELVIFREDLSRPQMFLRWVDGKAEVADALTRLHGDGDLLRIAARRQERRERERVPRVKSPLKLREPVGETSIPETPTVTWHETRFSL